jgi:hypothetical protein
VNDKDVSLSVEELLAVVIYSQGGRINVPAIDFTNADIKGKMIAIDNMNEGRVITLMLVDGEDIEFYEGS